MTHRLATNYANNYCNRTLIVKVIVENVVTCFLGTRCIYADLFLPSHRCLTPTLAEERLAISTQSIHRWKLHLVGYNSVANNMCLSSFV